MALLENNFDLREVSVLKQADLEEEAAELSRRLADVTSQLQRSAAVQSPLNYRPILEKAEKLCRYCTGISQVMSDTHLDMCMLSDKIAALLEDTGYDIQFLIRRYKGE